MKMIWTFLLACLLLVQSSPAQTRYFLVSDVYRSESYVVPIEDSFDIAHAYALIEYGPSAGTPIVVCAIDCTPDNINRDYYSPTKERWHWHVTEFLGFADATIEVLDGWPGLVEEDCDWWVSNATGKIGFWTYTVVADLGDDPDIFQCNFDHQGDSMGLADFQIIADHWLSADCLTIDCLPDTDHNGTVDLLDLEYCLDFWLEKPLPDPLFFPEWDCATQCHGDADCHTDTVFPNNRYPVYHPDLLIFSQVHNGVNWPAKYGDINYDPRADFDRDYDVDEDDEDILAAWIMVAEDEFPADCEMAPQ